MQLLLISYLDSSEATKIILTTAPRHDIKVTLCTHRTSSVMLNSVMLNSADHSSHVTVTPSLPPADVAFTRIGSVTSSSILPLVHWCELSHIPTFNSFRALYFGRNKLMAYTSLAGAGIAIPRTLSLAKSSPVTSELLSPLIGKPPFILKIIHGRKGIGVVRADSVASLRSQIDLLREMDEEFLLQEFIPVHPVQDIRVLVIGGHAIAAFVRTISHNDEFRSNLAAGATASTYTLNDEIRKIAEKATKALELTIAGVDIMIDADSRPLVIEVNLSPGLKGFINTGQEHVVDELLNFLKEQR
jgi:ribosomal protein S6--L-glutamate ligase